MMAATPETKVKTKVRKLLDGMGAYHFMPVAGPFGRPGRQRKGDMPVSSDYLPECTSMTSFMWSLYHESRRETWQISPLWVYTVEQSNKSRASMGAGRWLQ